MSALRRTVPVLFATLFLVAASSANATGPLRTLRAPAQHVQSFEPPAGWERAAAPPSSKLLATWAHHDGGKLTVVADRAAAGATADTIFSQSKPSLEKQGWVVGKTDNKSGRLQVDATLDKGKRLARQLYVVEDGFAYVITMVSPADQKDERARDFDDSVATLKLGASDVK